MTTDLILIVPFGSLILIGLYDFFRFDLRGQVPMSKNQVMKKILNKYR
jgi:hypothetical protein